MPTEFESLQNQLKFYEGQSQDLPGWKAAHIEAMHCRRVEDAVCIGISILTNLNRHQNRWSEEVQRHPEQFSWDTVEQFASYYRWWKERSEQLLRAIADCEERGFHLDDVEEFRQKYREVSLMSLDIQRVRQSVESLEAGRGVAFEQAMYALRNPVR